MAVYQWTDEDGTGDFGDGGNWINEISTPPMPGEPGAGDTADVDATGSIDGTGTVGDLIFYGDGGLLTGNDLQITAQVVILGGTDALTNNAIFYVSTEVEEASSSTVTLNGGSDLYIQGNDNANGSASAIGLDINVSAGGSASVLDLSGFGTEIYVDAENVVLGDAADASMTISAGAELDTIAFNAPGAGEVILGNQESVGGTMTVTGSYSSLLAGSTVIVGENGDGLLTVEAGAEVQWATPQYPGSTLEVGDDTSGTGEVLVTGAGSRLIAYANSESFVGDAGFGVLEVANHGFVELGGLVLGYSGGAGTVDVENAGSVLEVRGGLDVGCNSPGDLAVSSGGQVGVDCPAANVMLGAGSNGVGTISVAGKGSVLNCGNSPLVVGVFGAGTLRVSAGGSLNSSGSTRNGVAAASVGYNNGGSGAASVTGAGSLWTISGELDVGVGGTGTLTIGSGGEVSAGTLVTSVSGAAKISLSGAGSELVVGANAQLGGQALTTMSIGAGSTVSAGGTITLADAKVALTGGTLAAGSAIVVGQSQAISGHGTITAATIDNNATITSSGGTLAFIGGVNAEGHLAIGGGSTMSFDGYVIAGQNVQFGASAGTLQLETPTDFGAGIADFAKGDVIDLFGISTKSISFSGHTLNVNEFNGSTLGLSFIGSYSLSSFAAPRSDGHGGTLITHS
jgi:T5SS/PEP-CTERM-associated repeat protein